MLSFVVLPLALKSESCDDKLNTDKKVRSSFFYLKCEKESEESGNRPVLLPLRPIRQNPCQNKSRIRHHPHDIKTWRRGRRKVFYPPPSVKPSHKDHSPKPKNNNVVMWWVHLREICKWRFVYQHLVKKIETFRHEGLIKVTQDLSNYKLRSSKKHNRSQKKIKKYQIRSSPSNGSREDSRDLNN